MSAKFVYNMSDENPDLQKHIGCMNGIFQLFDPHHFLGGGGRIIGQNHKRLPPGKNGNRGSDGKAASKKTKEKNCKSTIKEKHRVSTESSRTSFSSSSCSSSLSSLECNKSSQLEPSSFHVTSFPEAQVQQSPMYQPNDSLQSSQQSAGLRNVVKDSIYREARGLAVKIASKEDSGAQVLKYIDSPRPLQHSQSVNSRVSGLKDPFRVLNNLREAPSKSREGKHSSLTSAMRDTPRFSYDGRESRDAVRSAIKLKELPRLSLDSRAGSVKSSVNEMKSNTILRDLDRGIARSNHLLNQQQEPGSYRRPSGVIAKLMGLEAFPEPSFTSGNQTTSEENKQDQTIRIEQPSSPWLGNADSVKIIGSSKFPIEPAPWKRPDGSGGSQTPPLRNKVTLTKAPNSSLSVYGEIDKRLAQLEAERSGKDLRALKQIEAMQKTREILETRKSLNFSMQTSNNISLDQNLKSANLQNLPKNTFSSTSAKGTSSPKRSVSPIMIMKPSKLTGKCGDQAPPLNPNNGSSGLQRLQHNEIADGRRESLDKRTAKDLTPRTNYLREASSKALCSTDKATGARSIKLAKFSRALQSSTESTYLGRSMATTNLRQQQQKVGLVKQSHTDLNRDRRQSSGQLTESCSPHRKPVSRYLTSQRHVDELSDLSSNVRNLSHGKTVSMQSESDINFASQVDDDEVSSDDRSHHININFIQQTQQRQGNLAAGANRDGSIALPTIACSEQPSPVSVLDATFYNDELPSPIKKISIAFSDDEALNPDEVEWNSSSVNHLVSNSDSSVNPVIDREKVECIEPLIQNLNQMLPSAYEELITYNITSPYNNANLDHRYISEILLASGLLKNFESYFMAILLHPTGYPIHPNIFVALEQAKANSKHLNDGHGQKRLSQSELHVKMQRKLVFDVVNEILVGKLILENSPKLWLSPNMLAGQRTRGQKLLGELCSEIDKLQGSDSNCSLDDDGDNLNNIFCADIMYDSVLGGLVLDVERLIFKDLITETIIGLRVQSARPCRRLFP